MLAIIRVLRWINRWIENIFKPLIAFVLIVMFVTVVWTVTSRLLGIIAPWTEKLMLILLPLLAFFVAPLAYRRAANIALTMLPDKFPVWMRSLHGVLIHLGVGLILLFALDLTLRKVGINPSLLSETILALTGVDVSTIRPFRASFKIPALGIQWRTVYSVMPLCIALMLVTNLELILRNLLTLFSPEKGNRLPPIQHVDEKIPPREDLEGNVL